MENTISLKRLDKRKIKFILISYIISLALIIILAIPSISNNGLGTVIPGVVGLPFMISLMATASYFSFWQFYPVHLQLDRIRKLKENKTYPTGQDSVISGTLRSKGIVTSPISKSRCAVYIYKSFLTKTWWATDLFVPNYSDEIYYAGLGMAPLSLESDHKKITVSFKPIIYIPDLIGVKVNWFYLPTHKDIQASILKWIKNNRIYELVADVSHPLKTDNDITVDMKIIGGIDNLKESWVTEQLINDGDEVCIAGKMVAENNIEVDLNSEGITLIKGHLDQIVGKIRSECLKQLKTTILFLISLIYMILLSVSCITYINQLLAGQISSAIYFFPFIGLLTVGYFIAIIFVFFYNGIIPYYNVE